MQSNEQPKQNHPQVGDVYRTKQHIIGDSNVDLIVTKVADGKVSYRVDGGRQRTFSMKRWLAETDLQA